jgi:Pyridoxamine 5'-phosphate oxidase
MSDKLIIPEPILPKQIPGYRLPDNPDHLLDWSFVAEHMSTARHYWISTVNRKNHPHAVPVWGLWYENRVYLEGSPKTAWASNAMRNPNVSVHLPDAARVVIIEGVAQFIEDDDLDPATWEAIDTLYQSKYQVLEGSPWILIHPRKVLAWDNPNLQSMTCWNFS